jgi:hypothetical protein
MVNKDWKGNSNSIYKTLGASNHTEEERETNDFYATDPIAAEWLLKLEKLDKNIWEPSCGNGCLSRVFEAAGHNVISSDLVDRGYGRSGIDFLTCNKTFNGDIITNPPYSLAQEFIEKALDVVTEGNKVIMFLKIQFLEGKARRELFKKFPPERVWVSSSRILCAKNGDFEKYRKQGSAACYCWYVWEKGYNGDTIIKWFN